jgi:hypothetical protein
MSRKTVHWGRNPDSGWWSDGEHYVKRDENGGREVPDTGDSGNKVCMLSVTQFVHISDSTIEFGANETNINECGLYGGWQHYQLLKIGSTKNLREYHIDRDTGFMIYYYNVGTGLNRGNSDYQCQRISGNAF